jgi:hypothetical protein
MPSVTVTIKSPSRDARLEWDAQKQNLSSSGNVYTATFPAATGDHDYQIFVWGAPGEAWSATVTGGSTNNQHAGHMSSSNGSDGTPDVPYTV